MADYSFVTHWRIEAPIDRVWDALYRSEDWPTWWRGVLRVQVLQPGDDQGLGTVRRFTWKSVLPYELIFDARTTKIDKPHVLEANAFGELTGTGRWRLEQEASVTHVRYDWNVRTTKPWMNLLAPLLRPAFAWNHDKIMGWGAVGLSRHLGARGCASAD